MKSSIRHQEEGDKARVTGQVSCLWLIASNLGSFIGSLLGAAALDTFGFQSATFIETLILLSSLGILVTFGFLYVATQIYRNCP